MDYKSEILNNLFQFCNEENFPHRYDFYYKIDKDYVDIQFRHLKDMNNRVYENIIFEDHIDLENCVDLDSVLIVIFNNLIETWGEYNPNGLINWKEVD